MRPKILIGLGFLGIGLVYAAYNAADQLQHMQNWDGITQPSFVGAFIKQMLSPIIAGLGGFLLPELFKKKEDEKIDVNRYDSV